jgi:hypothetical protein
LIRYREYGTEAPPKRPQWNQGALQHESRLNKNCSCFRFGCVWVMESEIVQEQDRGTSKVGARACCDEGCAGERSHPSGAIKATS